MIENNETSELPIQPWKEKQATENSNIISMIVEQWEFKIENRRISESNTRKQRVIWRK